MIDIEGFMKVVFLTMSRISDISQRGIYTDLMRKFRELDILENLENVLI